jgi:hypothetical protein
MLLEFMFPFKRKMARNSIALKEKNHRLHPQTQWLNLTEHPHTNRSAFKS